MSRLEMLHLAAQLPAQLAKLEADIRAEVDHRMASHPDLGDLDDWLR